MDAARSQSLNEDPPLEPAARADADDGAIHRDQGGQSGLPAVLPDGRFLRAVLRRRRDREPRARHRADQARQASRPRHPDVRRAGDPRRRIPAPADRARPPRRRLRADRGPGRGARSAAPRAWCGATWSAWSRPARSPRTRCSTRGATTTCWRSPARAPRADGDEPLRARLDRHLDRRIPHRRMRPRRPVRRDRAARAGRDHRLRRALRRSRARAVSAHAARGDAAAARRVRRRHRGAAARRLFRGRHHRRVRRAVAAGADRGGGLRHLCRAHAARQAAAAVAAGARGGRARRSRSTRRRAPTSN